MNLNNGVISLRSMCCPLIYWTWKAMLYLPERAITKRAIIEQLHMENRSWTCFAIKFQYGSGRSPILGERVLSQCWYWLRRYVRYAGKMAHAETCQHHEGIRPRRSMYWCCHFALPPSIEKSVKANHLCFSCQRRRRRRRRKRRIALQYHAYCL